MMIPSGSAEKSDPPHFFGLLRSRGQRPCCCGTAQKLDEFPSPHAIYSPAENHLKSNPLFDRAPCTRIATKRGYRCLSWVISRHVRCKRACPLYPQKRTCAVQLGMSAKCGGFQPVDATLYLILSAGVLIPRCCVRCQRSQSPRLLCRSEASKISSTFPPGQ